MSPLPTLGEDMSKEEGIVRAPSLRESVRASLNDRLRDALAEVGRYEGQNRLYWWRVRSMMDLETLGMVERYRPPSLKDYRGKQLPFRITQTGRVFLAEIQAEASTDSRKDGASPQVLDSPQISSGRTES